MITPAYVLRNGGATISTAITILQLKAGTGFPLELFAATLTQTGSTTSAQAHVGILVKSAAATVTAASAGTTLNKVGAHGITSDAVLSTSGSGYTATVEGTDSEIIVDEAFNVTQGWQWVPVPEGRIVVPVSGIIAMKFLTAPASHSWRASFYFRELR